MGLTRTHELTGPSARVLTSLVGPIPSEVILPGIPLCSLELGMVQGVLGVGGASVTSGNLPDLSLSPLNQKTKSLTTSVTHHSRCCDVIGRVSGT